MNNNYLNNRDLFRFVIKSISVNQILTSEIIKIHDQFTRNSVEFLLVLRDKIYDKLWEEFQKSNGSDLMKEVCLDVANFLSGLESYLIKDKLSIIRNELPHLSKWTTAAMARNHVLDAYNTENTLSGAFKNLLKKVVNDKNEIVEMGDEMDVFSAKLGLLSDLYDVRGKGDQFIQKITMKHFNIDDLDNDDISFKISENKKELNNGNGS